MNLTMGIKGYKTCN